MAPLRAPCLILLLLAGGVGSARQLDTQQPVNVTLAVLLPLNNTRYAWAWRRVGPAIQLAIERVNGAAEAFTPALRLRPVYGNSEDAHGQCSESAAPLAAVDLKLEHNPAVFLGPGCVYPAAPVARFTTHWKVPLLTAGATASGFDTKEGGAYALVTRAGPSHGKLGGYVRRLHAHFNWTRRAMLLFNDEKTDDRPCFFATEGIYQELTKLENITVEHFPFKESEGVDRHKILQEVKKKGRSKSDFFL